jgi:signal transduction histidine kinase
MPLFVGLLVVTFAIAVDLAHEAWTTARAQRATADRALRDFVRLSATSMSYQARANIAEGLHALFAVVGSSRDGAELRAAPGPEVLARASERLSACHCAPVFPASYFFRLALDDSVLRTTAAPADTRATEQRWLRDTLIAQAPLARARDWDVALIVRAADPQGRIVAYTIPRAPGGSGYVFGFVADAEIFGDEAFGRLERSRTGAASRGTREATYDSLVTTSVRSADGRTIYDAAARRAELRMTMVPRRGHEAYVVGAAPLPVSTLAADSVHLGEQYGSLILDVALTTSAPGEIVAGAVPGSRLFVLFGLLVLMAGLVAVAVHQLRREHELARLRANFTTGVSHELRTPLAQILLYGETLMLERTRSERERRAAAEVIVREARRLMHLVENALHFARAERPQLRLAPEPVNLAVHTREILVTFAPLAFAAQVTLREQIDDDLFVLIDPAAYRQILLNLLDNAVKFGRGGQTITVQLRAVLAEAPRVRLAVEDEGPGVPTDDRERIWAPFVRLPAAGPSAPGTGIGLAIVRDLAGRHGGRAWVESSANGGARFVVDLPASAERKDAGHDRSTPGARAAL